MHIRNSFGVNLKSVWNHLRLDHLILLRKKEMKLCDAQKQFIRHRQEFAKIYFNQENFENVEVLYKVFLQ